MAKYNLSRRQFLGGIAALVAKPVWSNLEALAAEHEHSREFYDSFKSLESLKEEVDQHGTALGYACLSGWYSNKGDQENVGKYAKRALELDSTVSLAHHNLAGYILRSKGQEGTLDDAQSHADLALKYATHKRDKVRAFGLQAIMASKRQDFVTVRKYVDLGLAVDPQDKALLYFKSKLP